MGQKEVGGKVQYTGKQRQHTSCTHLLTFRGYATMNAILVKKSLEMSFNNDMGFLANNSGFATTADFPLYVFRFISIVIDIFQATKIVLEMF
eukprot:m.184830 g.184830  ORF g.184830 m.184830 type:complete len:92 (-) comp15563_c2_seq2:766-1041(-)